MSEMDEIYKEQAEEVYSIRAEQAEKIKETAEKAAEETEEGLMAHAEKSLSEALADYNDDDLNYVVNEARIECSKGTDKLVCLKIGEDGKTRLGLLSKSGLVNPVERDTLESEKTMDKNTYFGLNNQFVRELFAFHSTKSSVLGDTFATVIDRTCLREYDDNEKEKESEEEPYESIVSCGNCKIFRVSDIDEIEKRMDKSKKYGTCYSLIKTMEEWTNPLCMEILTGECDNDVSNTIYTGGTVKTVCIRTEHHKPMRFETDCGEKEGLTKMSTLLCTRGGVITVTWSGQSSESIGIRSALNKMTEYLQGKDISEEELHSVIVWLANHCGLTVRAMAEGEFSQGEAYERSIKYDDQIIAWTYYWNVKIQKEFDSSFRIDPNIVKAMIAQESSFGLVDNNAAKNPSRNVMQSLAVGNDTVWVASGINPYQKMFEKGDSIAYKMLDGTVQTDGYLVGKKEHTDLATIYLDEEAFRGYRKDQHYKDFDVLKDIFEVGEDGKYMVVFENVTPDMSIATGIGCLANKIKGENGNIYYGVRNYNSEDNDDYPELINQHLENMGCDKLQP